MITMHQSLHLLVASVALLTGSTTDASVLQVRSPQTVPQRSGTTAAADRSIHRGVMEWMYNFNPGTVTGCSVVRTPTDQLMISISERAYGSRRNEYCGRSVEIRLPRDPKSNTPPRRTWGVVWDFCQDCVSSIVW